MKVDVLEELFSFFLFRLRTWTRTLQTHLSHEEAAGVVDPGGGYWCEDHDQCISPSHLSRVSIFCSSQSWEWTLLGSPSDLLLFSSLSLPDRPWQLSLSLLHSSWSFRAHIVHWSGCTATLCKRFQKCFNEVLTPCGQDTYQDIGRDHHSKCCLTGFGLLKDFYKVQQTLYVPVSCLYVFQQQRYVITLRYDIN